MEGCKHAVLGSKVGTKCGCSNSTWLQAYTAELGIKNLLYEGETWTCTICMEARKGLSEHCGLGAERHVKETLIWLTNLMVAAGDGDIASDKLEVCDWATVFRQLLSLHSRAEQGMLASAWKPAKVDTDNCQCTLVQATKQINLSATNSQPIKQDIPKEDPKGPL